MKHLIIFISFFVVTSTNCYCQNSKVNEIALSTSLVWNNTTIFNSYSGARAKDESGNAISNGISINYSKTIYKDFFVRGGIGYYNQKFGIIRGFDFKETVITTGLGYSTKYYQYKSLQYLLGVGYVHSLKKNFDLNFCATYNYFNSFQQEFSHALSNSLGNINPQIRNENYHFGNSLIFEVFVNKNIYKNFGIGLGLIFPVSNKWRKDEIFRENVNEFYGSNFSLGSSLNLIYSFNKK